MRKLLLFLGIALLFSSCGWLNPSIMFKTDKHYQYSKLPDSTNAREYRLSPNDIIEFDMYSNDGFKLVDLTSLNESNTGYRFQNPLQYQIESDGFCKLPIVGRTKLNGLTIKEAEVMLEGLYSAFYVKPFVLMNVLNRRVIVFPGAPGDAKVIPLVNNNTTLIEAIALAGGVSEDGKAWNIKLVRQNNENIDKHDVYHIDLSKIEGIKQASMVVQANDIIYVEPRKRVSSKFVQEIAPIVSIITSAFIIFTYTKLVSK